MADLITSLIANVQQAETLASLSDAYMAARRPCIEADRMSDLLAAFDASEKRLPRVKCIPLAQIHWA